MHSHVPVQQILDQRLSSLFPAGQCRSYALTAQGINDASRVTAAHDSSLMMPYSSLATPQRFPATTPASHLGETTLAEIVFGDSAQSPKPIGQERAHT